MACERPNYLIDYGVDELTHKRSLRFLHAFKDNRLLPLRNLALLQKMNLDGVTKVYAIPCGKCPSCIKAYRRMWSLRCEAESKEHKVSCFITLTYDQAHNPGMLVKKDLTDFIKSLRNRGFRIRYFGCGEYASQPHYHLIVFGYIPTDLTPICKSKSGFYLYKSRFIESLWKKGLCTIQEFGPAVAGYVAGYVDKKIDDGFGFLVMSRKPGIGHDFYIKHLQELYEKDSFVSKNGFVAPLPRYCDKVADSFFYDLDGIKDKRREKQRTLSLAELQAHGFSYFEESFQAKGEEERRRKNHGRNL